MQRIERHLPLYHPPRRGAALITAMVCLSLVAAISMAAVKMTLTQREQLVWAQHRSQTEWLVSAGLDRAARHLASETEYKGETWQIPAEQLPAGAASVTISVATRPELPQERLVTVAAEYPLDNPRRTKTTQEFRVGVPTAAQATNTTPE